MSKLIIRDTDATIREEDVSGADARLITHNGSPITVEDTSTPTLAELLTELIEKVKVIEAAGGTGIKGDKGDKGDPGDDGQDGGQGIPGTNGDDGQSAYQLAVAAGFIGDEATWLLSLKGADGASYVGNGINGSFTTNDGKTITIVDGVVTSIV